MGFSGTRYKYKLRGFTARFLVSAPLPAEVCYRLFGIVAG